jgi:hypothetical protein
MGAMNLSGRAVILRSVVTKDLSDVGLAESLRFFTAPSASFRMTKREIFE